MHVIGKQYSVQDHCLRVVLSLVTSVVLLACGCENSNGTTVTMKYMLGSSTVLEMPVQIASSRIAEGDWADGKSESLEVTWNRHPDVVFDEVWFGFNSSNLNERELLGYTINAFGANDRIEINYPSTHQLYMTINLRDVPSANRSRIRCITLVNRIDDSPVDDSSFEFTLNERAWRLATIPIEAARNGALAVRFATAACEKSDWKDSNNIDTLAAAYAEADNFAKAIDAEKKAIALVADSSDARLLQYRNRLSLYESRQKYRSPLAEF